MENEIGQLTDKLSSMMTGSLHAQALRVRTEWEPGLTHALGSVADECHKLIRKEMKAWKGDAATLADAGWEIRLKAAMARITAERTEVVKEARAAPAIWPYDLFQTTGILRFPAKIPPGSLQTNQSNSAEGETLSAIAL